MTPEEQGNLRMWIEAMQDMQINHLKEVNKIYREVLGIPLINAEISEADCLRVEKGME